jgi:hypothetical protein
MKIAARLMTHVFVAVQHFFAVLCCANIVAQKMTTTNKK